MKQLLITIAAVVLVGYNPNVDNAHLFHSAVKSKMMPAIKLHLAAGTDVNAKAKDVSTPLHITADYGHK